MVNMLIADDNIYYAKLLMDLINHSIKNIKVVNITIDGKETLERLNNDNSIDIVLLDLKMPGLSGIEVIHDLTKEKKEKYRESIIVVSGESEMITKVRNEETVFFYINKMSDMSKIIEKVDELAKYKEEKKNTSKIKEQIIKELQELNYNFSHKGTQYLRDAIFLVYTNKLEDNLNLKENVYPILAKQYNTSIHCIKSNIVKATDYMDNFCESNKKKEYFSFTDNAKPTVKLVIYSVLNNIYKKSQ